MVKLILFLKRKPGLSVEHFQQEWKTSHAEIARRIPGLRGYVQSHVLPAGYRKGEPAIDGIAELWFDDADAFREAGRSPEFAATRVDGDRLRDPGQARLVLTEEHLIKPGESPANGVKNVELVLRRKDIPVEQFHRYWREHHGPLAAKIGPMLRYVQSHAIDDPATRAFDGIASTWFDDTDAMRASARTDEYRRTREDEPAFVTVPLAFVITREVVILPPPSLS